MADLSILSSRAVKAAIRNALSQADGLGWVGATSILSSSDQSSETYPWVGQLPILREWIGGRQAQELPAYVISIVNKHFESTIEMKEKDMRRDKTGLLAIRAGQLAQRANSHWAQLLSTLILNGAGSTSGLCFDGQYFFDTDHVSGESGTQSNNISVDISALPVTTAGTTTVPSPEELQQAILTTVTQIATFVDDKGEPMNEDARQFLVQVPPSFYFAALNALGMNPASAPTAQSDMDGFQISLSTNVRLATWTESFAVFRTDSADKPFIRQEETGLDVMALGEESDFYFKHKAIQAGVDTWRGAGYGDWRYACKATLV